MSVLVGVACVLACTSPRSSSEGMGSGDASMETDASDQSPLDAATIGTWIDCDAPSSLQVFRDDGTVSFCESDGCLDSGVWDYQGTFVTSGGVLTMSLLSKDGAPIESYMSYYVSANRFWRQAFFPQGDHTGVVGSWRTRRGQTGLGETNALEIWLTLNDDMSASGSYEDSLVSSDLEGRWSKTQGDNAVGTYSAELAGTELPYLVQFDLVDEQVLALGALCPYTN